MHMDHLHDTDRRVNSAFGDRKHPTNVSNFDQPLGIWNEAHHNDNEQPGLGLELTNKQTVIPVVKKGYPCLVQQLNLSHFELL